MVYIAWARVKSLIKAIIGFRSASRARVLNIRSTLPYNNPNGSLELVLHVFMYLHNRGRS